MTSNSKFVYIEGSKYQTNESRDVKNPRSLARQTKLQDSEEYLAFNELAMMPSGGGITKKIEIDITERVRDSGNDIEMGDWDRQLR